MELKWLGTAGFEITTGDQVFLIDPYLSRNRYADPRQKIKPSDIHRASRIFISHSHFDHILDVPRIARQTNADIYCSRAAANLLTRHQAGRHRIKRVITDKETFNFQHYSAQAFFGNHIKFDRKLILSTLLKINIHLFRYLPLYTRFPCGRILSWRFTIEGKIIQFFGSAGSSSQTLKKIGSSPVDILLMPLQGHSNICQIGLNHIKHLKPKLVIPHHHDDFFPPVSTPVDISPFVDKIKHAYPETHVIIPELNRGLTL